jgi:hypothetical protein
MSHVRPLALALAATTLAIGGCGGSSAKSKSPVTANAQTSAGQPAGTQQSSTRTEASTAAGGLSRAGLIAKADAICRQLNRQAASIRTRTLQDIGRTAPELSGYYRTALVELRKLTPPAAMASDWNAMLADIQPLANEIMTQGRFATDNDGASTGRVEQKIGSIQLRRFTIAKRNGFTDCAEA